MNKETYLFNISDIDITVNTEEVITFYGESYKLTPKLIKDSAAKYTAQIKYYRMCNRGLTPSLIQRLLNEEYLMKKGESDGFKLQLAFAWFVEIKKEEDALYGSFRYAMKAYCLDNPQVHSRRFETLYDTLLHCLNSFNENTNIRNQYQSIEEYLALKRTIHNVV